jgi:ATP-binding cassette subfamily F protein uup
MQMATERKARSLYRIELEWMQRGARARSTKQKAHIKRFEELRDREVIETDGQVQINALSSRLGKKTIELNNICKAYDDKILIRDFSYILLSGDRIGIIGPNGCGKSTLLNILTGIKEPDSGTVDMGATIKIGYFSQENEYMDQSLKVIEYIKDTAEYIETSDGTITAAKMCERFLFTGAMQYTQIERLSGGEKRRLYLLKILMEAPNILILDEPTNDLDIQTLTILEEYLSTFPGIVVTVSHDRYFLDKIATRIFAFEGDGLIRQYEGNFSDYKEARAQGEEESLVAQKESNKETSQAASVATWKQKSNKLKFTYKEQKEYEGIDSEIEGLEQRLEDVETQIEKSATDYEKLKDLMEEKERLTKELDHKMERWVYLNDLAEQIEAEKNSR